MDINNLNQEQIDELEKLAKHFKELNPNISTKVYSQEDMDKLTRIEEKLDLLNNKIEFIFGSYFLLNGKFEDYKNNTKLKSGGKQNDNR